MSSGLPFVQLAALGEAVSHAFHRDGIDVPVEWVSFHTTLAGPPYMGSVVWPARRS